MLAQIIVQNLLHPMGIDAQIGGHVRGHPGRPVLPGVAFAPGAYEALFPSLSHTKDDLERTADIARAALDAALRRRA
mgnify:CR=1 FL=1